MSGSKFIALLCGGLFSALVAPIVEPILPAETTLGSFVQDMLLPDAEAGISLNCALNFDNTFDLDYCAGDKPPVASNSCLMPYTCAAMGGATLLSYTTNGTDEQTITCVGPTGGCAIYKTISSNANRRFAVRVLSPPA